MQTMLFGLELPLDITGSPGQRRRSEYEIATRQRWITLAVGSPDLVQ